MHGAYNVRFTTVIFIGLLSVRYNDVRKLIILSRGLLRDREKEKCIPKGVIPRGLSHDRSIASTKAGSTHSAIW